MRSPVWGLGGWLGALALVSLGPGRLSAQRPLPDSVARKVDAVFAKFDRSDSPGCALGIYRDDQLVYSRGYGSANLELGVPISPATVFDIGSTSKQFTAMSILLLARDGKLALDDDVRRYVPELPAYRAPVTIRHLLHHTSGVRDYLTLMELAGKRFEDVSTDADALDLLARQRALDFAPGTEWEYSNSGFFLLSVIVQRVSGQSLRRFAQANIFGPLGMTHTHFHDDHQMLIPNRATGYDPPDSTGEFRIDMSNFEQTGDGAVNTTVEDLLLWDRNFYSGKVGGGEVLAEMVKPGTLTDGTVLDYASGLFVDHYRGLATVAHGGAWAGYRAELLRFPSEHVSVACLCNLARSNPPGLARKVADVYLADRLAAPPAGTAGAAGRGTSGAVVPPVTLRALAGTYRDTRNGGVAHITVASDSLRLHYAGYSMGLRPVGPAEFEVVDGDATMRFRTAAAGAPRQIRISGSGLGNRVLTAIELARPSRAELARLAGEYVSPELGVGYRIALESDSLVLHARNLPVSALGPTIRDEFEDAGAGFTLHFVRDRGGRVTGFSLAAGRTQGLWFERRRATSSPALPRGR
jgi:CubicO group peptidase (beta-lactamase class C family)